MLTSRWAYLEIRTNPKYEDEVAAYAAGVLEGVLSRELVTNHYFNMFNGYCANNMEYCEKLNDYFKKQLQFMSTRSKEERYRSPFWNQVYLILKQMAGLEDGYKDVTFRVTNNYETVSFL